MQAGGAQETGPDAPFQLDMIAVVGGGLNIRMSQQWVAGVSMTGSAVMRNIGGEGITGSLEAGIYMGYVWGR